MRVLSDQGKPNWKELLPYMPNSDIPSDTLVYPFITAENDEDRLRDSAQMIAFLEQCALARYLMVNCKPSEIPKKFEHYFGAQGNPETPFFKLNEENKICEYDVRTGRYVELNPVKDEKKDSPSHEGDSPELDLKMKSSDMDSSENSDTASSESASLPSRSPSPVDPALNPNSDQLKRKSSGPSLFSQPSPRAVQAVEAASEASPSLSFEEQRDAIYYALRFNLLAVKDVDSRFLQHIKQAKDRDVLLFQTEVFLEAHERQDSDGKSFESENNALRQVRSILLSNSPDFRPLQQEAQQGKELPPPVPKIPPRQAPQASPAVVERASFKILLINAVMWFLERIAEFLARIQSAPISPFCAYRFTC